MDVGNRLAFDINAKKKKLTSEIWISEETAHCGGWEIKRASDTCVDSILNRDIESRTFVVQLKFRCYSMCWLEEVIYFLYGKIWEAWTNSFTNHQDMARNDGLEVYNSWLENYFQTGDIPPKKWLPHCRSNAYLNKAHFRRKFETVGVWMVQKAKQLAL